MRITAVLVASALLAATALGGCAAIDFPWPGPSEPSSKSSGDVAEPETGPDDAVIKATIARVYLEDAKERLEDVSIDVYQGRVMLTGAVADAADRALAVRLAGTVRNVNQVIDEIQVTSQGGFATTARDLIVETKLKAKLLLAKGIAWANYRWRAVNGIVYLFGQANDRRELDRVVAIARDTDDVRSVVTHVLVPG